MSRIVLDKLFVVFQVAYFTSICNNTRGPSKMDIFIEFYHWKFQQTKNEIKQCNTIGV